MPGVEPAHDLAGTRRTRTETVDHAAIAKVQATAFEAGGSNARAFLDLQNAALKDAHVENGRLQGELRLVRASHDAVVQKQQELVGELARVASQNVALTLAEGQNKTSQTEAHEKGESIRHGMTLVATNPYLGTVLKLLAPGIDVTPPRHPGPGNTPQEAAERFAAALRSGSEHSKGLLEMINTFCTEELERPGDLGLLLEFFQSAVSDPGAKEEAAS